MRRGVVAMAVVWAVVLGGARAGLARGDHEIDNDQPEVEMARDRPRAASRPPRRKPSTLPTGPRPPSRGWRVRSRPHAQSAPFRPPVESEAAACERSAGTASG